MKKIILFSSLFLPALAGLAQPYSVDWHKIAGGGGASSGGNYSLSGTIGQHDAGGAMAGGSYSLVGGFWSIVALQSPGVPNLVIQYLTPNSVKVSWPATGSYTLQQSGDVSPNNWAASSFSITTANGTNSIVVTPPVGNLFFRLSAP